MEFEVDKVLLENYRKSIDLSTFPKEFVRRFQASSEDSQRKWYIERFKCLKYPMYLSGYACPEKVGDPDMPKEFVPIMGMDFQDDPHSLLFNELVPMRPGENFVLSDLDQLTKKRMILWPRGLFKTSSIIVQITQVILNYPNVRICFLTGGDQLAKRQLQRVKRVFERPSPRFKFLFPEYCLKSLRNKKIQDETDPRAWSDISAKMGTAHEFTVPCRTNITFAEPTFAISTAKSVKSGAHFDMIFIDDLVNDQNYRSIKALEKCYQDYLDICPMLEPTGFMVVTGTRYSFGDTYERLQEDAKKEERLRGRTIWKFSIRDCWSRGCTNCNHTSVYHDTSINVLEPPCIVAGCKCAGFHSSGTKGVLFPATRTCDGRSIGHTLEFLEGEKVLLGDEFFANQYENSPLAAGAQTFPEALINRQTLHDMMQIPDYGSPGAVTFGVGDLAYVGLPGRDNSVIFMCRLFQGQIFIFDCEFGNWDSEQVAQHTVNMLFKHRPSVMFYEKFNGWDAYNNGITQLALSKGLQRIPIQWLPLSLAPNAKLARIGAVKAPLAYQKLWFYSAMKGYAPLVNQLTKWPKLGRHDDFADCAGMVVAAPTGYQLDTTPRPAADGNWLHKLNAPGPTDEPDTRIAGSYGDESWK